MKNWYEILEVSPNASVEVIRASAKLLSRKYHPDNKDSANAAAFRDVRDALECLGDPDKRALFNLQLNGGAAHSNGYNGQANGHQAGPRPGMRQVYMNGVGWIWVDESQGPFPGDAPRKRQHQETEAYPSAYPMDIEQMAREAAFRASEQVAEEVLEMLFGRARRRR